MLFCYHSREWNFSIALKFNSVNKFFELFSTFKTIYSIHAICMISGSKGQKDVHACMIGLFTLGPAKYEEVAIYAVNLRIPNICRIAQVALATKQFVISVRVKRLIKVKRLTRQHNMLRYAINHKWI